LPIPANAAAGSLRQTGPEYHPLPARWNYLLLCGIGRVDGDLPDNPGRHFCTSYVNGLSNQSRAETGLAGVDECLPTIRIIGARRAAGATKIDGVVFKVNALAYQRELGSAPGAALGHCT